ncbi:CPBP family intramembrane glutamic endopeptidase [Rheinheimera sp. 1928-s]|uniref:CPBP family intramembrane glutamic endopeptidase n=1 Tax=Rheinheimera sp. 1928-s TaxID=3033803 RepID=UPI00262220EC|nr:CPBP family intramembrane glutamic endopeptidase [Rheinheimera sp. 1928-s]MDF3124378.1 CPBP family intramembrane metalloprotease [Rheinheimera sp. 1928-s]
MSRNAIALYVALAFALSWGGQIPAILIFGLDSVVTKAIFLVVMWSPSLLALVFIIRTPAVRSEVLWRLGKPGYLPLGIVVQTAIGFAVVGLLVAAGLASSGWFSFQTAGVTVSGEAWLLGEGMQGWFLFLVNVGLTATVFSVFNLVAATGEEFAWRGFLQGQLTREFGVLSGIMLLAAIWWAWHLPGLLLGYNFPEYPIFGALVLFPLQMIGASLFLGWLTIRSGSFWPAALAHGTVNSIQQGLMDNLQLQIPQLYVDLLRTALIFGVGLVCWFLLKSNPDKGQAKVEV